MGKIVLNIVAGQYKVCTNARKTKIKKLKKKGITRTDGIQARKEHKVDNILNYVCGRKK
jgi:hypothetical protein